MSLPKPNVLAMPECAAPLGIGLDACNSGNHCSGQSGCDVYTPGSNSCGAGLGVGIGGIVITLAASAAGG